MDTAVYRRAQRLVHRWGVLAVPACFLTVGLQTAVILTTGVTGMPLRRFLLWNVVGAVLYLVGADYVTGETIGVSGGLGMM